MIANIRLIALGFRAELEDGRTIEHTDIRELASGLYAMGVSFDDAHCGDWREGDHILMSGQKIALKVALRRLAGWSILGATVIIFLDFDGVLHHENVTLKKCHPIARRHLSESDRRLITRDRRLVKGKNLFEYAGRLATCLESFPDVRIDISSTWREHFRPEAILRFLPPALADRVIGNTPFCSQGSEDGTRLSEVLAYVDGNGHAGEPWIALDDQARLFLDDDLTCSDNLFLLTCSDNLFLLTGTEGLTAKAAIAFCTFLRARLE